MENHTLCNKENQKKRTSLKKSKTDKPLFNSLFKNPFMKTNLNTIVFIVLAKLSFGQYQQYIQYISPYLSDSIQSGFFYFNTPNTFQAGQLYQLYRQNAPDLNNNMVLIDQHVDSLAGLSHLKYQQTYMDIPIEGAGCIEHYDTQGSLLFINAKVADVIKKDHRPRIKGKIAIDKLIDKLKKNERIVFAWEDKDWETQIQLDNDDPLATWYPTAELIWAVDTLKDIQLINPGTRYNLAYKISITLSQPEFETFIYYVDANTGGILKFNSTHINDGPAGVYGYGSKIIDTQWKGGFTQKYILQTNDATRVIHTKKDESNQTPWWVLSNVKDGDDIWGNTYLTETSTHYHVANSWDFFRTVFGRTGQNNQSRKIRVRTQIGGQNMNNAFFQPNGGSHNKLSFGKTVYGADYGMEPSVVAHEFTHGVTHHTSNLGYLYESGALNESFSDIFGIVIQAIMLDGGSTDWLHGNFISNSNQHIRSLKEPKLWGEHIENGNLLLGQPDTYNGIYWYSGEGDYGGVHINSGVQNKWFYVLAHGDNGTNDLSNYYDVNGIGMTKAAQIAYYALTSLLMNSSQYSDSRQATIQASKILFGECSVEHQATIDAWYAVGIGSLNDCPFTATLNEISEQSVSIYPNPTSNSISIELPVITDNPIRIVDLSGNLIREFETNQIFLQTDLSGLANGVYLVNFNINGNRIVKRIIVQK